MEDTKDWLEVLLKSYSEQNTISKIISTESKIATSKGDNFTSVIKRVTMDVILKSGKKVKKSVIIKEVLSTQYAKEFMGNMGLFMKETVVYRDILPYLEDIMIEHGDYTEPIWGTCLDYTPYDRLVFDDLSKYGYVMCNRKLGLDLEHCMLVMRSLAKFHATSLILNDRGLISMDIFSQQLAGKKSLKEMFDNVYKEAFRKLLETMDKSWEPEWKPVAEKIRKHVAPNALNLLLDLMTLDDKKFNVLCHGDCWVNNMLFKYGVDGVTPISVKFVDFQVTYYNSPAFDLKYFLSTSTNLDVRKNSIQKLIELYHETLLKEVELYKYEGNLITLDCLNEEMKRIDLFGLIMTMNLLPIIQLEDAEVLPEVEEMIEQVAQGKEESIRFNAFEVSPPSVMSIIKETLKNYVDNHLNY